MAESGAAITPARRDGPIDVLRGVCILLMVTDHLGSSTLLNQGLHLTRFVGGASGFVFLSGYVLGMLTSGRLARLGEGTVCRLTLQRAVMIYALHVFLTTLFTAASDMAGGTRIIPHTSEFGGHGPVALMILTLQWQPRFMDILPLYVGFLLLTPLFIGLLRRGFGWLGLLVSVGFYAAVQAFPRELNPFVAPDPVASGFHFGAWQFLFFGGLLVGYHRPEQWLREATPARDAVFWSAAVGFGVLFVFSQWQAGALGIARPLGEGTQRLLFAKSQHGILRLAYLLTFLVAAYVLMQRTSTERGPLGVLRVMGANSLYLFVAHLFLVMLNYAVLAPTWSAPVREVALVAQVALLYGLARLRPVLVSRWYGGVARGRDSGGESPEPSG